MRFATAHAALTGALLSSLLLASPARAQFYRATLTGAEEVPANASTATGAALVHLNGDRVTVTGAFHGLSSPYFMSHVHEAPPGENGPIRFDLTPALDDDKLGGQWEAANTTTFSPALVTALMSGGLYVNVHWAQATLGIRGQLLETVVINEVRASQAGEDEYFELAGAPGTSLNGLTYVVIGGDASGPGIIEYARALEGQSVPADGYFLAGGADLGDGVPSMTVDLPLGPSFGDGRGATHLLVTGLTGALGDDLDTDDDGALDARPWTTVVDAVGLAGGARGGVFYDTALGFADLPVSETSTGHAFRDVGTGAWRSGAAGPSVRPGTPGAANVVAGASEPSLP